MGFGPATPSLGKAPDTNASNRNGLQQDANRLVFKTIRTRAGEVHAQPTATDFRETHAGFPAGFHKVQTALRPADAGERTRLRAIDGGAADLLTAATVARKLGVCTATVYKLCERGELAHVRILNAIRVAPADLATYLARASANK